MWLLRPSPPEPRTMFSDPRNIYSSAGWKNSLNFEIYHLKALFVLL